VGRRKKNEPLPQLQLWAVTMIDPANGWIKSKQIKTKRTEIMYNVLEKAWLTHNPQPSAIILDKEKEIMSKKNKMIENDYDIWKRLTTVRNPNAKSQAMSNIIYTFTAHYSTVRDEDSWGGILAATMFAIRSTEHASAQYTLMQLVHKLTYRAY